MDRLGREIDAAEQKLIRLQIVSKGIQKEIRALRQTRENLQDSIKAHIEIYKQVEEMLNDSIGQINDL